MFALYCNIFWLVYNIDVTEINKILSITTGIEVIVLFRLINPRFYLTPGIFNSHYQIIHRITESINWQRAKTSKIYSKNEEIPREFNCCT